MECMVECHEVFLTLDFCESSKMCSDTDHIILRHHIVGPSFTGITLEMIWSQCYRLFPSK